MRLLVLGVIFFAGCGFFEEAARHPGELKDSATVEPSRAEAILLEFFTTDFAQRKIAHLVQYDFQDFDRVVQPRPRLADVLARFGEADRVVEQDLQALGARQLCQVHYFGRLGLVVPVGQPDAEVYWVLIPERPRN